MGSLCSGARDSAGRWGEGRAHLTSPTAHGKAGAFLSAPRLQGLVSRREDGRRQAGCCGPGPPTLLMS